MNPQLFGDSQWWSEPGVAPATILAFGRLRRDGEFETSMGLNSRFHAILGWVAASKRSIVVVWWVNLVCNKV